ncbi:MAG: sulfate reduction electron transfer complex DsrMKJOP subunit DsrO [Planctomycetota bacterium]
MNRRDLLKAGGLLLGGAACATGIPLLTACPSLFAGEAGSPGKRKWGMVIDLGKCTRDCTACVDACRKEHNVALHGDERWDVHLIRKVSLRRKFPAHSQEISAPLLCNHCDHPPCVQACPVAATHMRADGIVIVDQHRCIGCRYCMIACPYNARYFHYRESHEWPNKDNPRSSHGVPQSCNLCAHRLDRGKKPACVEACAAIGRNALVVGDLNDRGSDVAKLIARNSVRGIREDLGTKPKVLYMGL